MTTPHSFHDRVFRRLCERLAEERQTQWIDLSAPHYHWMSARPYDAYAFSDRHRHDASLLNEMTTTLLELAQHRGSAPEELLCPRPALPTALRFLQERNVLRDVGVERIGIRLNPETGYGYVRPRI